MTDEADEVSAASRGSRPVAWAAWFNGEEKPNGDFTFSTREHAESWCYPRGARPEPLYASRVSRGEGFNEWLARIGKTRETATEADEIQWLRLDRQRLREAIRRLAEQDATLAVCDGNVTVTIDNALTPVDRLAIEWAAAIARKGSQIAVHKTLRRLLERLG